MEHIPVSTGHEPVIKHNITQRASGRKINSFERINVILESCVMNISHLHVNSNNVQFATIKRNAIYTECVGTLNYLRGCFIDGRT